MKPDTKIVSKIKYLPQAKSKSPLYIKLDSEVLDWFKAKGKGYQSFINEVLKAYKEAAQNEVEATNLDSRFEYAQRCFREFYAQCFWHLRKDLVITESEIPLIKEGLKKFGGKEGFIKAQRLCQ